MAMRGYVVAIVIAVVAVVAYVQYGQSRTRFAAVEAISADFDWRAQDPRPFRPFKAGPYHMTMGIRKLVPSDWLLIERTYKTSVDRRLAIIRDHPGHTVLYQKGSEAALKEAYEMIGHFLTCRYPQYFQASRGMVKNGITGNKFPARAAMFGHDMRALISTVVANIEEDFLLMMQDPETGEYRLRAGSFAAPAGFDPAQKLGLPLRLIHTPVPMYKDKLEKSMDRYFTKLQANQFVERTNWSVQTHTNLYAPAGHHGVEGEKKQEPLAMSDLDFDQVFLRVERQTLVRLPQTGAIVFTIRTYLTPMSTIKQEAEAPDLIKAIDQLPEEMARYKRAWEWGPAVQEYLAL